MIVKLMNSNDIEEEMNLAGWVASVSTDFKVGYSGEGAKVAKHCIESNHGTPTRAMRFVFDISGISRACANELVRHEIGVAKCQGSQRYVKEDNFEYVTPNGIKNNRVLVKVPLIAKDSDGYYYTRGETETWLSFPYFQDIVEQMYEGYVKQAVKPEDARYVLTNATCTSLHVVFDWEGLLNFCRRRRCLRAQWEIRELANKIAEEVTNAYPYLGEKLTAPCEHNGFCEEKQSCGKYPKREEIMPYILKYKRGDNIDG